MTVVFLHGFTHTGASWGPVIAALGERYRGAIAPDIRGHGRSASADPITLEAVVADIAALDAGQLELVGYSMGGRLALHAALAIPERIERLVLIGASPGIRDPAERAARREADGRLADRMENWSIAELADHWDTGPAADILAGQPTSVRATARADRLRSTPEGLARALRGLGTGALPSVWERLGELRMPVTLIVGERDQKFRAIAEGMAVAIGGQVRVIVVPGAGHAVHLEAPTRVAEIVADG